ncbi:MAG: phospholipid-binding protein MlaC [Alphaproteobacteria bacterium]
MIASIGRPIQILFLVAALLLVGRAEAQADAASFIGSLAADAVPVLTNRSVPEPEREQKFSELLDKGFDMEQLSSMVLGRYWRTASPEERTEFTGLLRSYLIQIYADRFSEFQNVELEVGSTRTDQGTDFVTSTMRQQRGPAVQLEWRVERVNGRFVITDLVVEGVSMVITQRSEFASVIRQRGGQVSGLIDLLRQRTRS